MLKISNSPDTEPSARNEMPAALEAACLRVRKNAQETVGEILSLAGISQKIPASPDKEWSADEQEECASDGTKRKRAFGTANENVPAPVHVPRDLLGRKSLDFVQYGASGFYFGLASTVLAIETITENGYLLSHFLLRQFPDGIELGFGGQAMATVFMLKNAAVFGLCSTVTGLFAKFALENGVRKNPYIRPIGSSLRLQSTPFSDSGEIHFHAQKPFYEEAAKSKDPDQFIALRFVRDFKKGLETFATEGFLKRTGGNETLSQIILHSPLITEERMESIGRMVSKYPNLELLADTRRLPVWKERAAELTSKNVPIFETWPELLPKSRDFIFKGSPGFGWIGPK